MEALVDAAIRDPTDVMTECKKVFREIPHTLAHILLVHAFDERIKLHKSEVTKLELTHALKMFFQRYAGKPPWSNMAAEIKVRHGRTLRFASAKFEAGSCARV